MNKVVLIGRVTKDIELRETNSGKKVVKFTVAVNRLNNEADFINCVAWEKTAELLHKFVQKGHKLAVDGRIQVQKYQNKDGENRYSTDVIADRIEFLEKKQDNDYQENNGYQENQGFIKAVEDEPTSFY